MPAGKLSPGGEERCILGKIPIAIGEFMGAGGRGTNQLRPTAPAANLYHQHLAQGASRPAARKRWPICFLFPPLFGVFLRAIRA